MECAATAALLALVGACGVNLSGDTGAESEGSGGGGAAATTASTASSSSRSSSASTSSSVSVSATSSTSTGSGAGAGSPGPWCGYFPSFNALDDDCYDGCVGELPASGSPSVLFTLDDAASQSLVVVGGDATRLFIETFSAAQGNAVVASPTDGGAPVTIDTFSGAGGVASNVVITADAIYYLRTDSGMIGDPCTTRAFRWDPDGSAPATPLGVLSTSACEVATLALDGDFLYAWTPTSIRRVAIDGSGVDDLVLSPVVDATEGDGTVFFMTSYVDAPILAVSSAGGAPATIATPTSGVRGLAVDTVNHLLVALTGDGIVRMNEDGTNLQTFGGAMVGAWGPMEIDGSRAYFFDLCERIPDGDLSAQEWFDFDTLEHGWVGEEPGFPFVPHASATNYGNVWTTGAIYGYYRAPPPDHGVH